MIEWFYRDQENGMVYHSINEMFAEEEINTAIEYALRAKIQLVNLGAKKQQQEDYEYIISKIIDMIASTDFWIIFFDKEVDMNIIVDKIRDKVTASGFDKVFFSELEEEELLVFFIPKSIISKADFYEANGMDLQEDYFPYHHITPKDEKRVGFITYIIRAVEKSIKEKELLL